MNRRGFLGSLLGLGAAAAIDPSSILGLEGAYARTYVETPAVGFSVLSQQLKRVYGPEFFEAFQRDFTPFLEGIDDEGLLEDGFFGINLAGPA